MQRVEVTGAYQVYFDDITSDLNSIAAYVGWYQLDSALITRDMNEYGIAPDRPMELGDWRRSV